jgi:hypothetical protein
VRRTAWTATESGSSSGPLEAQPVREPVEDASRYRDVLGECAILAILLARNSKHPPLVAKETA